MVCSVASLLIGVVIMTSPGRKGPPTEGQVEVGAFMSYVEFEDSLGGWNALGRGGAVGFRWKDHFDFEVEVSHYERNRVNGTFFLPGIRVGVRTSKFGGFARIQSGLMRMDDRGSGSPAAWRPAFGLGGILEFGRRTGGSAFTTEQGHLIVPGHKLGVSSRCNFGLRLRG